MAPKTKQRPVGEVVREFRGELTQQELAERSGLSQPLLSQIEKGRRLLTDRAAVALERALGLEPYTLVDLVPVRREKARLRYGWWRGARSSSSIVAAPRRGTAGGAHHTPAAVRNPQVGVSCPRARLGDGHTWGP